MYWYCSAAPVILFCRPSAEYLREADVEEQPLHDAREHDQALQELLVGLRRAGAERGIRERIDERDQELVLVAYARDLVVGVEHLALVEPQALDDVLVGVGVYRLLERLAQQVLPALRRGDVAVGAEHDVVRGERVGGDEKSEIALHEPPLVLGESQRVLPQLDVAAHLDFLRHPVIRAGGEILFPGPLVLERHELVDVGRPVDDALVGDVDAPHLRRRLRPGRRVEVSLRRKV
jgi:hypothetical protein